MPWHYGLQGAGPWADVVNTLSHIAEDPNSRIHEGKVFTCKPEARPKGGEPMSGLHSGSLSRARTWAKTTLGGSRVKRENGPRLQGRPLPPTRDESHLDVRVQDHTRRQLTASSTDTTVCIGCKACEVACKEWNQLPVDHYGWKGHSYDNTGELRATTWRHVAFHRAVRGYH